MVSYQSNRKRPFYRWFKYKEGFSAALVEYVLDHFHCDSGTVLDPFAGSGAALLASAEQGLNGLGIELLPIGVHVIQARLAAANVKPAAFQAEVDNFTQGRWQKTDPLSNPFPHLRITEGAFSSDNERQLNHFRAYLDSGDVDLSVRPLLELACLSVLENISYTRKDGQYLRWDHRAPRSLRGKTFNKGPILSFHTAMGSQLRMMAEDLLEPDLLDRDEQSPHGVIEMREGSCLAELPAAADDSIDWIITSPPYCNRYDYTRTYALELAYLGVDEEELKALRQDLLSCTVENRCKLTALHQQYADLGKSPLLSAALDSFENQEALQEVLTRLDQLEQNGLLNNSNVPRMVRNYFLESAVVIFEMARALKPGGHVIMVNDNVQYGGEEIPADLILSDLAANAGLTTEAIWVLARGKGNSSQQMGLHGRNELRKCAYVWKKD